MRRKKRRKRRKGVAGAGAGAGVGRSQPSAGAEVGSREAATRGRGPRAERREGAWGRSGGRTRKGKEGVAAPPRGTHRHVRNPADWATRRLSCRYWKQ